MVRWTREVTGRQVSTRVRCSRKPELGRAAGLSPQVIPGKNGPAPKESREWGRGTPSVGKWHENPVTGLSSGLKNLSSERAQK